jgi:hypothetical protein
LIVHDSASKRRAVGNAPYRPNHFRPATLESFAMPTTDSHD